MSSRHQDFDAALALLTNSRDGQRSTLNFLKTATGADQQLLHRLFYDFRTTAEACEQVLRELMALDRSLAPPPVAISAGIPRHPPTMFPICTCVPLVPEAPDRMDPPERATHATNPTSSDPAARLDPQV